MGKIQEQLVSDSESMTRRRLHLQELVETRDDDSHDHPEDPNTKSVARHVGVICVSDGRSDLWVWRVLLEVTKVGAVEVRVGEVGIGDLFDGMLCRSM